MIRSYVAKSGNGAKSAHANRTLAYSMCTCWRLARQHYPHWIEPCVAHGIVECALLALRRGHEMELDDEPAHWALAVLWLFMCVGPCPVAAVVMRPPAAPLYRRAPAHIPTSTHPRTALVCLSNASSSRLNP